MRRGDLIVAVALGVAFVSAAILLFASWFVFPALRLRPTGILISAAVIGGLFLVPYRVGTFQASANRGLRHLAHQFRIRGHRVAEKDGHISVRIGRFSALKVRAEPVGTEARIRCQLDATRSGWALLVLLVLFDWTRLVAPLAGGCLFLSVRSFADRVLRPLVPTGTGALPGPPEDAVRAALLDALAEANRLATDAYEAERSTFWNFELVIIASVFPLWFFILLSLGINSSFPPLTDTVALLAATLVSAVAASAVVQWRFRDSLEGLEGSRTWSDRLSDALIREVHQTPPEVAEPSSFEVLAEATKHVPAWLGASRKAGVLNDPLRGSLFATVLALDVAAVVGTVWLALQGSFLAPVLGILALGLSVGAELGRRLWERHQEDLFDRTTQQWERRIASLQEHMEHFLRDL